MILAAPCLLAGCQTNPYAGSFANFSTAVNSATRADQAAAQAAIAARNAQIDRDLAAHPEMEVSFDTAKCSADHGYKPGDCAITFGNMAMIRGFDPGTAGLVKYAAALNAVVSDKSAATFGTAVGNLGSAVQGLSTTLGETGTAAQAGPIATIVEQLGEMAIEARRIEILRKATAAADPVIAELAIAVGDRDAKLTRFAIQQQVVDLETMRAAFKQNPKHQAADLAAMVKLAAAIDQAQQVDPRAAMVALAKLHKALTDNLANPTVNWAAIQSNAQALVQTLETFSTAADALAAASAVAPATPAKN